MRCPEIYILLKANSRALEVAVSSDLFTQHGVLKSIFCSRRSQGHLKCAVSAQKALYGLKTNTRELLGGTEENCIYPDEGTLIFLFFWPPQCLIVCTLPAYVLVLIRGSVCPHTSNWHLGMYVVQCSRSGPH